MVKSIFIVGLMLSSFGYAADPLPMIKEVHVQKIGETPTVASTQVTENNTKVVVAIPVQVAIGNTCTTLSGQMNDFVKVGPFQHRKWIRLFATVTSQDNCPAADPADTSVSVDFVLPKEMPTGNVTYSQEVLIDHIWYRVTYTPTSGTVVAVQK